MAKLIMTPDDAARLNEVADKHAIKPEDMPRCVGVPDMPCRSGATDFVIKGYDDKFRCVRCNEIHVELVMKEAGDSSPNQQPRFVSAKLDKRAAEERTARLMAMADAIGQDTRMTAPRERDPSPRDPNDFNEPGISDAERRARILRKYSGGR